MVQHEKRKYKELLKRIQLAATLCASVRVYDANCNKIDRVRGRVVKIHQALRHNRKYRAHRLDVVDGLGGRLGEGPS